MLLCLFYTTNVLSENDVNYVKHELLAKVNERHRLFLRFDKRGSIDRSHAGARRPVEHYARLKLCVNYQTKHVCRPFRSSKRVNTKCP